MKLIYTQNQSRNVKQSGTVRDILVDDTVKKNKRKKKQAKYIALNTKEKALFAEELVKNNKLSKLNYTSIIDKEHKKIPKSEITTHKEFINYMTTKNFQFLFPALSEWELDNEKSCILVDGNFAWISQDEKGVYRYFTKLEGGYATALSIFDLIELRELKGVGTKTGLAHARRKLCQLLEITYKEMKWEMKQEEKIVNNLKIVADSRRDMARYFPSLYRLIEGYMVILGHVNTLSLSYLSDKEDSVKGEAVFFSSAQAIAQQIKTDKDKTIQRDRITRMINLFATLGLINKVHEKDVPADLLQVSKQIRDNMSIHYLANNGMIASEKETKNRLPIFRLVNYYTIPEYNADILIESNRRAELLLQNGITNIELVTEKSVTQALGKVIAKKVYATQIPLTKEQQRIKEIKKEKWEKTNPIESRPKKRKANEVKDFSDLPF